MENIQQVSGDNSIQIANADTIIISSSSSLSLETPFIAPNVEQRYVVREIENRKVKDRLLAEAPKEYGILKSTVIHGEGGCGKSTLTMAVAHDDDIVNRYKDGILWADLGDKADVLKELGDWIRELGDQTFHATNIESAKSRLRSRLNKKAVLMILDNVWHIEDVKLFQAGGTQCHLLITTRNAEIANELGVEQIHLQPMTASEAFELMANWAGEIQEDDLPIARRLARGVNFLPLGLKLLGAQVKKVGSWTKLNTSWDSETGGIKDAIERSFQLSINKLGAIEKEIYLKLCVFEKGIPFPVSVVRILWQVDAENALLLLNNFANQAILSKTNILDQEYFYFHDLLFDFVVKNYGKDNLIKAQKFFIDNCRSNLSQNSWSTLPETEKYLHNQLVWHLLQSGQVDEIHYLLQEQNSDYQNSWYQKRESLGQASGYISDIKLAWSLVEENISEEKRARNLSLAIRYALVLSSLSSLAESIPPDLLALLVEANEWSAEQAVAYAKIIPNLLQREEAYSQLAPVLAKSNKIELAEKLTNSIKSSKLKKKTFRALSPYSEDALKKAHDDLNKNNKPYDKADSFIDLLIQLDGKNQSLDEEAFCAALDIKEKEIQFRILQKLHPCTARSTQEKIINKSFELLAQIKNDQTLAKLLPLIGPNLNRVYIDLALKNALNIQDEFYRVEALIGLDPYLPTSPNVQINRAIRSWKTKRKHLTIDAELEIQRWLDILSTFSREPKVVLQAIDLIKDDKKKFNNLVKVLNHRVTLDSNYNFLVIKTLSVAKDIENIWDRTRAILEVFPKLPPSLQKLEFDSLLNTVNSIQEEWKKARGQMELIQYCPKNGQSKELVLDATKSIRMISEESVRKEMLELLIAKLIDAGSLKAALNVAKTIEDSNDRTKSLKSLGLYLMTKGLPIDALKTVELISWEGDVKVDWVLEAISAGLLIIPPPYQVLKTDENSSKKELSVSSEQHFSEIDNETRQVAKALTKLALSINDLSSNTNNIREIFEQQLMVNYIDHDSRGDAQILIDDISKQPKFETLIKIVELIKNKRQQITLLALLIPNLAGSEHRATLNKSYELSQSLDDGWKKVTAFLELIPLFKGEKKKEVLSQLLDSVEEIRIQDEWAYSEALTELSPLILKLGFEETALSLVDSFSYPNNPEELAIILDYQHVLQNMDSLFNIQDLSRLIVQELDEDISADEVCSMIEKPDEALAFAQSKRYSKQAYHLAQRIESEWRWRIWTQVDIYSTLLADLSDKNNKKIAKFILTHLSKVDNATTLANTLTNLGPFLSSEDLADTALGFVQEIENTHKRTIALLALAPYLPTQKKMPIIETQITTLENPKEKGEYNSELIFYAKAELISSLPDDNRDEYIIKTLNSISDLNAKSSIVPRPLLDKIAPFLSESSFWKTLLVIANEIDDLQVRHSLLHKLAENACATPTRLLKPTILDEEYNHLIHRLSNRNRKNFMSDLCALLAVFDATHGAKVIRDIAVSIQDVTRWWP